MAIALDVLIHSVQNDTDGDAPLDELAVASATVEQLGELGDALLNHFIERCRAAGHSWSEIGGSLGVSKQAVQKRFTRSRELVMSRCTPRTTKVVLEHAPAVAGELGHGWVGTEHLLLALWGEPGCIAVVVLERLGVTQDEVREAILARVQRGDHLQPTMTPRAMGAFDKAAAEALQLGHNYIGTEHLLLAMLTDDGGMAREILAELEVTRETVLPIVIQLLSSYVATKQQQK